MDSINLDSFPKIDKQQWKKLATKQLKGQDPNEQLSWDSDGLKLEPYYDSSDIENLNYLVKFFQKVTPFEWKLYEEILIEKADLANEQALHALQGGCDGIIFRAGQEDSFDLDQLLKGILTDICDISFIGSSSGRTTLNGFDDRNAYASWDLSLSQVDNIVKIIRDLASLNHILRIASPDFFLEVASIRALRFLLNDKLKLDESSIQIHTLVPIHDDAEFQWFLNTTAGLASILGGTNSICFRTALGNSRISRNVGNMLREESGIKSYNDPCNGSFFVESLTHQIIESCKSKLA